MKLNKDICQEHLDTLKTANEQWFNGYHYSVNDYLKLVSAMHFFNSIKDQQRSKLIKEGLL